MLMLPCPVTYIFLQPLAGDARVVGPSRQVAGIFVEQRRELVGLRRQALHNLQGKSGSITMSLTSLPT
jgi:hypothetical protein